MHQGIYEELISKLVKSKIENLGKEQFYIKESPIDRTEAATILSNYLAVTLRKAFNSIKSSDSLERQIEISNMIIILLRDELSKTEFNDDIIEENGRILKAVFSKVDASFSDFDSHLDEITPYTRLSYSELFTGGNVGISLDSELRKEILSADRIDLLVSFIKWNGIRILEKELREFTNRGGKLRVITTTYIGATDAKAVEFIAALPNTEIKISYNVNSERLHAKAYLFYRNSSFHTAYIGSSNFSKTALTSGLEWNLKITTKEISHVIDKFEKTFDTYWQNLDFESYHISTHKEKLINALDKGKTDNSYTPTTFFDLKPHPFQQEILEKLEAERSIHRSFRNLIVAATGTGKTVISAFDYKAFRNANSSSKLLFVAHRKEILQQAQAKFQGVLRDNNFGELWVDGALPKNYEHVFASIQTLNNQIESLHLSKRYYDYIIIDEVHHIAASSYRIVLNHFEPKILLGLTATPERMDGENILEDFNGKIAAEIRLPEALNKKLLCPFQYFGITDSIDLSGVTWSRGRYLPSELSSIYIKSDKRVGEIISNLEKYLCNKNDVRALGFCITQEHAIFMAKKFNEIGLKASFLVSNMVSDRENIRIQLEKKEINYLFVVDIFNEGVDIPEIDTVLFLRPTESLTVFLQQLGRGLRLADSKECLTVLDFVGNARPEYDFEGKFRALVGKTNTSIKKEIEDEFPHLPLGCSIVLEKKAKEFILSNIKQATKLNRNAILQRIKNYEHQTSLPLTLKNFIEFYQIPLQSLYSKGSWRRLCAEAGKFKNFESLNEKQIVTTILKKWLSTNSFTYFDFIRKLASQYFRVNIEKLNSIDQSMCLMLHYDINRKIEFVDLQSSIDNLGMNMALCEEIVELMEVLISRISFKEISPELPYDQPLMIHSRYTRDQILVAFGLSTFKEKSSNREGVAENTRLNTEILFIDLIKSEENFSPTTMYDDYAINERLFHWQSQNQTRPDLGKGLTYIKQKENGKKILLFVREKAKDEFGNTMGYVFIGEGKFIEYNGSKPMNIKWELKEPLPPYLWKDSAKLSIS